MMLASIIPTLALGALSGVATAEQLPIPSAQQQGASEKLIHDVFKPEAAKTPEARTALAQRMLKEAGEPSNDAPSRYVLLTQAFRLSCAAGDWHDASRAIDALAAGFIVDPWAMRIVALRSAESSVKGSEYAGDLAFSATAEVDDAIKAEQYDAAKQIATIGASLAAKTSDRSLQGTIASRQELLLELSRMQAPANAAAKTLRLHADDAEANRVIGKYELLRGEWGRALPALAKGTDSLLASVARRDLATGDDVNATADAWWDASETQSASTRSRMRARAAYWYAKGLAGDLKGLNRLIAQKRVAEIAPATRPSGESQIVISGPHAETPARPGAGGKRASPTTKPAVVSIDLLALVGAQAKPVGGKWHADVNGLESGDDTNQILLPYAPPEEYDLTVAFTRRSGGDTFAVILPLARGTVNWVAGGWGNTVFGFSHITANTAWHHITKLERAKPSPMASATSARSACVMTECRRTLTAS